MSSTYLNESDHDVLQVLHQQIRGLTATTLCIAKHIEAKGGIPKGSTFAALDNYIKSFPSEYHGTVLEETVVKCRDLLRD